MTLAEALAEIDRWYQEEADNESVIASASDFEAIRDSPGLKNIVDTNLESLDEYSLRSMLECTAAMGIRFGMKVERLLQEFHQRESAGFTCTECLTHGPGPNHSHPDCTFNTPEINRRPSRYTNSERAETPVQRETNTTGEKGVS